MAGALKPPAARAGVSFELDSLDLVDDRLVVRGQWFGTRGLRFMRPTLVVAGRPVLAGLEHKPWAPEADPWVAAFPWTDGPVDIADVALAVAPSVTVALDPDAEPPAPLAAAPAEPVPASRPAAAAPQLELDVPAPAGSDPRLAELEDELAGLRERLTAAESERDALRVRVEQAEAALAEHGDRTQALEQVSSRERRAAREAETARDELRSARATAERERDQAIEQRDEAMQDREAAVRARRRMEAQRDEALRSQDDLMAERDAALRARDDARMQREEVLLAHRTLQRQVHSERAEEERGGPAIVVTSDPIALPDPAPRPDAAEPPAHDDAEDAPIGVRTVPAARGIAGELLNARETGRDVTRYDLWAIRVLGSVAAACFILLLAMILRAFLL